MDHLTVLPSIAQHTTPASKVLVFFENGALYVFMPELV